MWNFAVKQTAGDITTFWLGLCLASIVCSPFAGTIAFFEKSVYSTTLYVYIIMTGVFHALYVFILAKSYEEGDISTVYPIARGFGVAGTAFSAYLFLKETISFLGFIGIGSICTGIFLIGLRGGYTVNKQKDIFYALLVGCTIVSYSIVDKIAVGFVNPVFYIFGMFSFASLLLSPYVLFKHRSRCLETWRKMKKNIFLIGVGSMGTYLLILFAFQLSKVSYVVAAREFSVVIGSILGFRILKEKFTFKKGLGILAITAGLIIIKIV